MSDTPAPAGLPSDLRFQHPWRAYQARVLAELEAQLDDRHLHVVAAPGAGKTVLGLEVVRRIDKPTVILAPTLTVRNQWVARFRDQFSAKGDAHHALIGHELGGDTPVTVSTYQSLHAALNREGGEAATLAQVQGIGLLVFDEAHHLRREWWRALDVIKRALPDVLTLSLTATPPYDVGRAEWSRYFAMCGPIDAEISIPELVAAGNLAPHQDFVHFALPSEEETSELVAHRQAIDSVSQALQDDPGLARAILGHPWFANFDVPANRESVLDAPEVLSAMVVYLHRIGHECLAQRTFLGVEGEQVPALDRRWLETLLTHFLFTDPDGYDADPDFRAEIRRQLARANAVEKRQVRLGTSERLTKQLRASDGKLASILAIQAKERASLSKSLRMVVLVDHVRRELLERPEGAPPGKRLGAVPIFEHMRLAGDPGDLCLLTGSLVILPRAAGEPFDERLGEVSARRIPHPSDHRYVLVNVNDGLRNHAVAAVTELFNQGIVRTLVGTAALLGEGWDAVGANTLVLATAVATHVQTNQMRGRVIRIDPAQPSKASNIWHLACAEPNSPDGGADIANLRRRFRTFEGLTYDGEHIESGFERIVGPSSWTTETIAAANDRALSLAADRERLGPAWEHALAGEAARTRHGLVQELRATNALASVQAYRSPYPRFRNRLALAAGVGLITPFAWPALAGATTLATVPAWAAAGTAVVGVGAASGLLASTRDALASLRQGAAPHLVKAIANVLLDTLSAGDVLEGDLDLLDVRTFTERGETRCALEGGTLHDANHFLGCLEELLAPIDNPRYLLVTEALTRGHRFARSLVLPNTAYAVPTLLGKKADAEQLAQRWQRDLGPCELIYTRTAVGRQRLLRARAQGWSLAGGHRPQRVSRWR